MYTHIPLTGIKLQKVTQSLSSKIIRTRTMEKPQYREALDRRTTARNTIYAQDAAAGGGDDATEAQIWKSICHKDDSRSIRYFLLMAIHDGYALDEYWQISQDTKTGDLQKS